MFTQTFWDILKDKVKLSIVEKYNPAESCFIMNQEDFSKQFLDSISSFLDSELSKFDQVASLISKLPVQYAKMLANWQVVMLINKYYEQVLIEPKLIVAILEEIEKLGGAFKILNNMNIYLKFHPTIRDQFQRMIKEDQ